MGETLELPPVDFPSPEPPDRPEQTASPRRHRRVIALSAAVALVGGGVGAPLVFRGGPDKKVSAPAPVRPRPSAPAAKTAPRTSAAARPSAHRPAPSPSSSPKPQEQKYDKTAIVTCLGLRATQSSPDTIEVFPILKKAGHPDPNNFVTVVDLTHTSTTSAPTPETQVAKGFGTPIEVTGVHTDASITAGRDLAAVSVYYYPEGVPSLSDPAAFSFLKPTGPGTDRIGDGCGEAGAALQAGGVLMNPAGP